MICILISGGSMSDISISCDLSYILRRCGLMSYILISRDSMICILISCDSMYYILISCDLMSYILLSCDSMIFISMNAIHQGDENLIYWSSKHVQISSDHIKNNLEKLGCWIVSNFWIRTLYFIKRREQFGTSRTEGRNLEAITKETSPESNRTSWAYFSLWNTIDPV